MKKLTIALVLTCFVSIAFTQSDIANNSISNTSLPKISLSLNAGYDVPLYRNSYTYQSVTPSYKAGFSANYFFKNLGIGLDYDYINNGSASTLNDVIYYDSLLVNGVSKTDQNQDVIRHFIGIGPSYRLGLGRLSVLAYGRGGYSLLSGGEVVTSSSQPGVPTATDYHVVFAGIDSRSLAAKGGLTLGFNLSPKLSLDIGAYYMRHFSTHLDSEFDFLSNSDIGIYYGHSDFIDVSGESALSGESAHIVSIVEDEPSPCNDYASVGVTLGLTYHLGFSSNKPKDEVVEPVEICEDCNCPNDGHKVLITVRDELSQKIIPGADILVKNSNGGIVATGTTNSYGVVDLGELPHDTYEVEGNVYGVKTTVATIDNLEFTPGVILRKELLYTDLRFILKGKVVNRNTRALEPGVLVNLTKNSNRAVEQTTSDSRGGFAFRLEKSTSYSLVGVKQNRLSDVARVSTVGLNRSTTLFVDLELGIENFDCGQGFVLDIKYEFDSAELLPESRIDLDRLVRYLQGDHRAKVELSSHTDSRGPDEYNQDLSQRRAQSAVDYIKSRGIANNKIIARGYGETQLKNRCADGVSCSEAEHRVNRRTEAKLLCN